MTNLIKNVTDGVGQIFLNISPASPYVLLPKNGFIHDNRMLATDSRKIMRNLNSNIRKVEKNGKTKQS